MKKANRPSPEAFWYTPREDRERAPELQSRFLLSPLSQAERVRALDDMTVITFDRTGGDAVAVTHRRDYQVYRGLVLAKMEKAENFPEGAPQEVPPKGDGTKAREAREKYIDMLDEVALYEIGAALLDHSSLGDAEKNS